MYMYIFHIYIYNIPQVGGEVPGNLRLDRGHDLR